MNKKYLFILSSPLHVCIMKCLIKELNLENITIVYKKELENIIPQKYKNRYILYYPKIKHTYLDKIINLLKNMKNKNLKSNYEIVFIPDDQDIYIQILLKNIKYKELNFIEEGGTLFYKLNKQRSRSRSTAILKYIAKKTLNLDLVTDILQSKNIKKAYVFFPEKLRHYNNAVEYIDLNLILKDKIEKLEVETKFVTIDYIILTQPLTEDGIEKNNKEVEIIKKFITPNKNYLIKLHPRDNIEKYKEILELSNVEALGAKYQYIPYQVIHYSLNPKNLVTHFSSVLYSVPKIREDFKRIALVKDLTNKKILESVMMMAEDIEIEIQ